MIQCETFKIFHLIKVDMSEVPYKVFLAEDRLTGITSSFRFDSKVIGLVGTIKEIQNYILTITRALAKEEKEIKDEEEPKLEKKMKINEETE